MDLQALSNPLSNKKTLWGHSFDLKSPFYEKVGDIALKRD